MTRPAVYLDHAATTPVRPEVLEAMLPYLTAQAFGNPSSAHRFGRTARAGLEQARREVAQAVGAEPNQVIFTSGGTEADNLGHRRRRAGGPGAGRRDVRRGLAPSSTRPSWRPRTPSATSAAAR